MGGGGMPPSQMMGLHFHVWQATRKLLRFPPGCNQTRKNREMDSTPPGLNEIPLCCATGDHSGGSGCPHPLCGIKVLLLPTGCCSRSLVEIEDNHPICGNEDHPRPLTLLLSVKTWWGSRTSNSIRNNDKYLPTECQQPKGGIWTSLQT